MAASRLEMLFIRAFPRNKQASKQASKQRSLKMALSALARLAAPTVEAAHPSRAARPGIARRRSRRTKSLNPLAFVLLG